jgi:hypothetical protein
MVGNLPATPDNMAIDEKGLIYTVTRGEGDASLKRLNIAGGNMIEPDAYDEVPAAVAVGNHDNVYVLSQQGYIYEYNNDGELLFVFSGSDDGQQRMGLSIKAEAIQVAKDDKEVYDYLCSMSEATKKGYLESICLYRFICLNLPQNDSFVMHAAVIEADNKAYAFTARSGTGKSTHISLWKKY